MKNACKKPWWNWHLVSYKLGKMAWINLPAYIQKTFFFFFFVVFCSFGRWGCGHATNYRNSVRISFRMWRHVNVTWNWNRTDFLERFWFWQMDLTKGHMTSYFSIILFFSSAIFWLIRRCLVETPLKMTSRISFLGILWQGRFKNDVITWFSLDYSFFNLNHLVVLI